MVARHQVDPRHSQAGSHAWAGHEQVVWSFDPATGYRGIIAIHDTSLGPAIGGTRFWHYSDTAAALHDALRLSHAMTLKASLAGLPVGGGKSVVLRPAGAFDREAIFLSHGRAIESLAGRYVTAEDVGSTAADMATVARVTSRVVGVPDRSGDPSPMTALGVLCAMSAAAEWLWGTGLAGRKVAVQGCGGVGAALARLLLSHGASVVVADIDRERARALAADTGAEIADAEELMSVPADVFAPCALGGILQPGMIERLPARLVVGGANNQLRSEEDAELLARRGVLYVPDFLANAGGLINGYGDLQGQSEPIRRERVTAIGPTTMRVLELAERSGTTPTRAATDLAMARLRTLVANRFSLH